MIAGRGVLLRAKVSWGMRGARHTRDQSFNIMGCSMLLHYRSCDGGADLACALRHLICGLFRANGPHVTMSLAFS